MGLKSWWRNYRARAALDRKSIELNENQDLIAAQVPELTDMTSVEGMAYVLEQINEWNKDCTPEQAQELATRLAASQESFTADGLVMPYWGNLWVLRTYQLELGLDVPRVAPPNNPAP